MPAPSTPARTLRNAGIEDLVALLEQQHRQKLDVVMPLSEIGYNGGHVEISGQQPALHEDGFYDVNGLYRPTNTADLQVAALFDIPAKYMRKMRSQHVDLLDLNVNEWAARAPEDKRVLVRTLWGTDPAFPDTRGVLRAVLSDRYGIRDNFDTVLAVLDGMRAAGLDADNIKSADVTDDRLFLRVHAPQIYVNAPELLKGYRDPRSGEASRSVGDVIFAGLKIENSETGGGAFKVTPELTTLICMNGQTINKDALRKVHLGAKLDEGAIVWSDATRKAANELTKQQVADAVASFMNTDYVSKAVNDLEKAAGVELSSPTAVIETVGRQLSYTEDEKTGILSHFIKGGQLTAGGVMHAVSSFAQDIEDVTRSHEFGSTAVQAMEVAASHAHAR